MGNISRVREPDYAVALAEAYNDYVYDHYAKISPRLHPIAVIPPQDPERAALELRRAVKRLGYRAAVVRTTGLRLPLGHKFYDPIYREAEALNCPITVHGTNGMEEVGLGRFRDFYRSAHGFFSSGDLRAVLQHDFSGCAGAFPEIAPGVPGNRLHLAALLARPHG